MTEGEIEEDVNVDIKILPYILKNILDNNRKWKADGSTDCRHCKVQVLYYSIEDPREVDRDR